MNLTISLGTFGWCWYPHLWLYRETEDSKGALGFAWLGVNICLDFSRRDLASRSYIEKGLYQGDPYAQPRPTVELDWKQHV